MGAPLQRGTAAAKAGSVCDDQHLHPAPSPVHMGFISVLRDISINKQ